MTGIRKIHTITKSNPTIEGAGVHLKRVFGFSEAPAFDPFLLMDDFRSDIPDHYIKGFPWHPHRGIETITYVLKGDVEHGDSLGNKGIISGGDVQWMTAGSGIIHQEMPKGHEDGDMLGFQLWANLPASHKMMSPRYRDIRSDQIPVEVTESGVEIRVICGSVGDTRGPVQDVIIDPEYLDVSIPPGTTFSHPTKPGHTVFAYIIAGEGVFGEFAASTSLNRTVNNETLVLFEKGDRITVSSESTLLRFLLVSGAPIGEPVAWQGPIVMNTQQELQTAFEEYRNGTFIKDG
jgi:redox-sensitive bicupin YhaK (pirin superfamily)